MPGNARHTTPLTHLSGTPSPRIGAGPGQDPYSMNRGGTNGVGMWFRACESSCQGGIATPTAGLSNLGRLW